MRALGLRDDAHVGPGFTVRALGERREGTEYHLGIGAGIVGAPEGFGSQGIFLRLRAPLSSSRLSSLGESGRFCLVTCELAQLVESRVQKIFLFLYSNNNNILSVVRAMRRPPRRP